MGTEVQQQIQQDWENREFIEIVSEGIKKIAEFLNEFGKLEFWIDVLNTRDHHAKCNHITVWFIKYCGLRTVSM